ncbi:NAD(P)-dependent oxidoreductase [Eremococcus coleocola]|uniref:Phosphogluconate dehydrogenase (Decarboxylating), NAD binding domain protein n=1 Tax=Eremococcus coleocola ACS-139-V-Col8 TaxID=908337 RepID=E4KPC5_9LACT|nr:NAD(P)-dependent oxidoreductase [Eremococcus coleocola]EFR30942.1 phosphogluconate dehydrogenase (decarboxylating), NAD binding domain protein [Eremococcus coleocola ACS-139-V-Col8]
MTKVGFIGLGVMGSSMAKFLLADHELYVYNRTKSKADELIKLGANWCSSPQAVAEKAEIILTIVGYPQDVEDVYLGTNGLFNGSRSGQIFIDLTTSSPSLAQKLWQKGQEIGVTVFDAPVSGGDIGARKGELSVMVGGPEDQYEKVQPILAAFAKQVQYFGSAGSGQHTKMANQIMVAATMLGLSEALVYADQAHLELEQVIDALSGGAAANFSLANYGPRILAEDYSPGFFVKHFVKDLKIVLEEAEKLELELPMTHLASLLYQKLSQAGYQDAGTQAIIKLWWK